VIGYELNILTWECANRCDNTIMTDLLIWIIINYLDLKNLYDVVFHIMDQDAICVLDED
jgi:hypothetical protein